VGAEFGVGLLPGGDSGLVPEQGENCILKCHFLRPVPLGHPQNNLGAFFN
jgi:hypothetical protein